MIPDLHIMHTPVEEFGRSKFVEDLKAQWPEPVTVWEDPLRRGVLWNYQRAIRAAFTTAPAHKDWAIVSQDDVVLFDNTLEELPLALRFAPAPFVSLCHFGTKGLKHVKRNIPYGLGIHGLHGQMVAYHRSIWKPYLEFVEDMIEMDFELYKKWDDGIAAAFNLVNGTRSCMTARAVVQHADVPSVLGHNLGHWRHAHATIENHQGPWWGLKPRHAPHGSVKPVHRELAAAVVNFRRTR